MSGHPPAKKPKKRQSILLAFLFGAGVAFVVSRGLTIMSMTPYAAHKAILFDLFVRTVGGAIGMALVAVIFNLIRFRRL
jgi:hypothetical protein